MGAPGAQIVPRDGTPEVFLPDPDGIKIQLQHAAYGYGSGPRGDVLPTAPRAGQAAAFQLKTLNHVTLTTTNGIRGREFYQRVFGLPLQTSQGAGATLRIGAGPDNVTVGGGNNPGAKPGINHVCFTIDNFDPNRVMGILIENGLTPIEYGNATLIKPLTCRVRLRQRANNGGGPTSPLGTAELYFNDPDNIPVQIQDVSYCGGSGWLGQICP
jgi:catechol 2,3-dioxygenase-like lactoylglutathione lyase family enzyme